MIFLFGYINIYHNNGDMTMNKEEKEQPKARMQPLSMHPLKPEEALTAFMKIDKKKLLRAEKKEKDDAFLSA